MGRSAARQTKLRPAVQLPDLLYYLSGPWAGQLLGRLGLNLPLTTMKIPVYYWQVNSFLPHTWSYEGESQLIQT
jgi:hypothetical protein